MKNNQVDKDLIIRNLQCEIGRTFKFVRTATTHQCSNNLLKGFEYKNHNIENGSNALFFNAYPNKFKYGHSTWICEDCLNNYIEGIKMNDELLKEKNKFYLIWCATKQVGTHKHFTFKEAEKEAVRLAKINPGESFVILESKAFAKIEKPTEVFYYE